MEFLHPYPRMRVLISTFLLNDFTTDMKAISHINALVFNAFFVFLQNRKIKNSGKLFGLVKDVELSVWKMFNVCVIRCNITKKGLIF